MLAVKRAHFTSYSMIIVVGRISYSFQHVSISVNQNARGTNECHKINLVCTTLKYTETHMYINKACERDFNVLQLSTSALFLISLRHHE